MSTNPRRRIATAVCMLTLASAFGAVSAQRTPAIDLKTLAQQSLATLDGALSVRGLREPVEVVRDRWGVPHIYARNTDDLFFAQGYVIAQDRLWQLELWRRQREGRLAEILGPSVIERDWQARLLMFRGPFDEAEWTSYHPEGKRIITAFVNGLNAYIAERADNLPVEFKLTGIKPEPWKPETALLRTTGMGDATSELQLARLVARVGVREANRQRMPDPWDELDGARRPRRQPHRPERRHAGRRTRFAAARNRRSVPRLVPASVGAARDARGPGARAGQQQLGSERRAHRHRQAARLERSAPRGHQPVAALHHAPHRTGLERDRRAGAAVCRHRARPQRAHRMGLHDHRDRSARRVRRGGQPVEPERSALSERVGAAARHSRDDSGKGRGAADRRPEVQPARPDLS